MSRHFRVLDSFPHHAYREETNARHSESAQNLPPCKRVQRSEYCITLRIKYGIHPKKSGICPNQIWDKYHFSGTQLWRRAQQPKRTTGEPPCRLSKSLRWCARCMDPFERCWNVCAKPARGRVHPVAVVTASSRMSRNSRAGWPPVLQPTGAPCEGWSNVHSSR